MEYTDKDYNIIDKKVYDVWSNKYKKGSPAGTGLPTRAASKAVAES